MALPLLLFHLQLTQAGPLSRSTLQVKLVHDVAAADVSGPELP
jgi:hypothetical protein